MLKSNIKKNSSKNGLTKIQAHRDSLASLKFPEFQTARNQYESEIKAKVPKIEEPDSLNDMIKLDDSILNDVLDDFFEDEIEIIPPKDVQKKEVSSGYETFLEEGIDLNDSLNFSINMTLRDLENKVLDAENVLQERKTKVNLNDNLFYGLPLEVKQLVKEHKGIEKLYDWQNECLCMKAIEERKNLIYALPTSGGKTLVAEILMLKEIVRNKKNAIFVLPFVALVQEKIQSMIPFALKLGFLIEEYAAEKGHYPPKKRRKKNSIYICTIEKAHSLVNSLIELQRLDEIGIMVVDELHLLGENGGRGACLESMLTKTIHANPLIHIIGMSATIGNIDELAKFLNAELYIQNFRPVEIKEYVKCEDKIWLINTKEEDMFTDMKTINYKYSKNALERDPDFLGGLVMDVAPKDSCLIFCSNKKNCENVALLLTQVLFRSLEDHKKEEKKLLIDSLEIEGSVKCPILSKTIKFGVAYHHSGLTMQERKLLEDAFRVGTLCVICCTSTLAAGVNLPARRVILRSPYIGADFLSLSRYKQMCGRAGRAGLGEIGESIIICRSSDLERVRELLASKMDDSLSSLHVYSDRGLNALIISCVLLSIATTRSNLHNVMSKSLLKIQEKRLGVDTKTVTDEALIKLIKSGILRKKSENNKELSNTEFLNCSFMFPTQLEKQGSINLEPLSPLSGNHLIYDKKKKNVVLIDDSELELCPLGRAALKGSMSLTSAQILCKDLKKAQESLVLVDHLHLLYVITPYDIAGQITPNGQTYYETLTQLPPHQMQVARLIGIDERVAFKLRKGVVPNELDPLTVRRFYVTLILHDLWLKHPIQKVAEKYNVNRGMIQQLLAASSSFALSIVRFCQELQEFWAFTDLLTTFGKKLTYCCASELEPLMELPFIKEGRAKQLYKAGYKTLLSIAKANRDDLTDEISFLSKKVATQIISAAKFLLLQKVENLKEEVDEVLDGLKFD